MKNKMIAACGDELKKIGWLITFPKINSEKDSLSKLKSVCPTCYHNYYKRVSLKSKRIAL